MEHDAPHELDPRPLHDEPTAPDAVLPETLRSATEARGDGLVELGRERSLDPRHVVVERMLRTIMAVALSGGLLLALVSATLLASVATTWSVVLGCVWFVGTVVLATLAVKWPQLVHEHASYRVDTLGIEIRRGVWWRSIVSVPRSRVQHIDVSQGPLERRHGLGSLTLFTAGTEHAQVQLAGLDHAVALAIRDHLLPSGGDDAV